MSTRYIGSIISATPPTISTSSAKGIWTIVQQMQAQAAGTWPQQPPPGGPFWIGLSGATFANDGFYGVAVDSSSNVYYCWAATPNSDVAIQIQKFNTSGTNQWQRQLRGVPSPAYGHSVAVDTSGNVYICGSSTSSGTPAIQTAKYNTSGTIQWQRRLDDTFNSGDEQGYAIAVDSSGNAYVGGWSSTHDSIQIAKYNTSGVIQWQRRLSSGTSRCYGIAVDSSANVYICGWQSVNIQIAKYDTSGAIQWQRNLSGGVNYGQSVAVDSSGNVYVCGYSDLGGGLFGIRIAKYNTSGTIQWQRRLGGSSNDKGYGIAVDSSGNVYVCGVSNSSGNNDLQIAKYNTSGTIQWQRRLGSSNTEIGYGVAVDSFGNVYVCGITSAALLIAKLPSDGSLTGTYTVGGTSFTYAASGLADAVSSLTSAASSLSDQATSLPEAATSLTDAAVSLTNSVTTI